VIKPRPRKIADRTPDQSRCLARTPKVSRKSFYNVTNRPHRVCHKLSLVVAQGTARASGRNRRATGFAAAAMIAGEESEALSRALGDNLREALVVSEVRVIAGNGALTATLKPASGKCAPCWKFASAASRRTSRNLCRLRRSKSPVIAANAYHQRPKPNGTTHKLKLDCSEPLGFERRKTRTFLLLSRSSRHF